MGKRANHGNFAQGDAKLQELDQMHPPVTAAPTERSKKRKKAEGRIKKTS
jgi:hypothetical protein